MKDASNVIRTDIKCPILPHEASDTAHIVPVIAMFFSSETIHVSAVYLESTREPM